jgi:capsular exopolysaccharide synthesis family protein
MMDAGSENELSLRDFINIWLRRRWLIIGFIILGAVSAVLLIVFMKPVYESTATIEYNQNSSSGLDMDLSNSPLSSLMGGGDLGTELKTEIKVLQSDSLAMAVIRQLNLSAQPPFLDRKHPFVPLGSPGSESPAVRTHLLKVFDSQLKVSLVTGTQLIKVSFRSPDPKQAADVANAIIDSYKEMYFQTHYAAISEASEWMTTQLADLKANVESSEKQLTDFEKASGILTVPTVTTLSTGEQVTGSTVHSPVIQKLDDLNTELTAAETDRIQKEAIYRLAATGNAEVIAGLTSNPIAQGSSLLTPGGAGAQDLHGLELLEAKRSDLQVEMAQGRAIYGPHNRHLQDLQTQMDSINGQVQDEIKKVTDRANADLKVAQHTENAIRARFNDAQVQAGELNEKNVQLSILSQEAFSRKKLYEDLYTKLQEADVSAGMKATNITVVDPAFASSKPVLPRPVLFLGLGIFVGILLGFGSAHLVENVDTTVVSLPEIEEITGSAVIAVIPDFSRAMPGKKSHGKKLVQADELQTDQSKAWILSHPTSIASEAFRALRTGIFLSRPGGAPKTLLITSSVPAEGKSTVAFNLAVAIAQNGRKVIIVEADMRRPVMKRFLSVGNDIGLSSVLADVTTLDEAIACGVGTANLDVLPAGPVPPLPAELLSSIKFDSMLKELRSRYDFVLIDSPPALILTDAMAIASKVDAVVWIVRAGTATRPHLMRAAQQIRRSRMPFVGYVLNGLDNRVDPYGYGYSYYGYNSKRYGAYYGEDRESGK